MTLVKNIQERDVLEMKIIFFSVILLSILGIYVFSNTIPSSGFMLGDADPLLNDIWIEPKNPKPGDAVSIHSEVYNIGTESTMEVTDVVTIGYLINGEIVKIDQLVDVKPGSENGIEITSGPVWDAANGEHIITVIIDYHDTLSHITDDSQNNIMQKILRIGDHEIDRGLITFEILQQFIPSSGKHEIQIDGEIKLPGNLPLTPVPQMDITIGDSQYKTFIDVKTGEFYFKEILFLENKIIPVTASFENERFKQFGYTHSQNLYPLKLDNEEAGLVISLQNPTNNQNFRQEDFTFVIYDEDYNEIKKIRTNSELDRDTFITQDSVSTVLETGIYNIEVYYKNESPYAMVKELKTNRVTEAGFIISESDSNISELVETKTEEVLREEKSGLNLRLENFSEVHNFVQGKFTVVIYDEVYQELRKINTNLDDSIDTVINQDLLSVTLEPDTYNLEIYFEGRLLDAAIVQISESEVTERKIIIPEYGKIIFKVVDATENPIKGVTVKIGEMNSKTDENGNSGIFEVFPTIFASAPEFHTAQMTFDDGIVKWTEPFSVSRGETIEKIFVVE